MKWKKFTLKTTTEAVDYISSLFDEIGIQGIEIEDNVPLTDSETKPESADSAVSAAEPAPLAESEVNDAILATAGDSAAASAVAEEAAPVEEAAESTPAESTEASSESPAA